MGPTISNAHHRRLVVPPPPTPRIPTVEILKLTGNPGFELRGHEERLRALRARRTDLEVERIVAGTELRAARAGSGPEVPGAAAGAVVDALDRLRRLESSHAARLAFIDTGARSHEDLLQCLQDGDHALAAWLDADREGAGAGGQRTAKRVFAAVLLRDTRARRGGASRVSRAAGSGRRGDVVSVVDRPGSSVAADERAAQVRGAPAGSACGLDRRCGARAS